MKVLLVCKSKIMENLGVMYLSAVIKQCGHECRIEQIDLAERTALEWQPDFIGYSIMTGSQNRFAEVNESVIEQLRAVTTFAGGPHPSFFSDDPALQCYNNIVKGEAEQYFADILNGDIKYETINSIPWPDRTDFPNMKIRDFISSRGCPHSCAYCFNDQWNALHPQFQKVRIRDAKDVCAEIEHVNPEFVYFQDSCFGINMKWMEEFTFGYDKRPFHCHMRPKQVTGEMVKLLWLSGCASIRMALESASDRLRRLMNRPNLDTKNVLEGSGRLKLARIKFMIQNILGLPTSTIEDDLATLEFNIRCFPDYAWSSIFSPYPGTKLGDLCHQNGWYKGDYSEISDSFFAKSVLEFSEERKEQTYLLQKVFALCVEAQYLPKPKELTAENFPQLVHNLQRKIGDHRLYAGIL